MAANVLQKISMFHTQDLFYIAKFNCSSSHTFSFFSTSKNFESDKSMHVILNRIVPYLKFHVVSKWLLFDSLSTRGFKTPKYIGKPEKSYIFTGRTTKKGEGVKAGPQRKTYFFKALKNSKKR